MGLKDKLRQRAAKSPPRDTLEVYTRVGEEMHRAHSIQTSGIRCGYHVPQQLQTSDDGVTWETLPSVTPTPFYLKLGKTFYQVPVLTSEAGTLPLCDGCRNQLDCLDRQHGDIVTPKDLQ